VSDMKLSRDWVKHSRDITGLTMSDGGTDMWRGPIPACECGISDFHAHCSACGLLVVIGSPKMIKRYSFRRESRGPSGGGT
jgi:hypothetical protein